MKLMRGLVLVLMVLSLGGCFDGDRGVLTELVVQPLDAPVVIDLGELQAGIPAGTGSELVISPIPVAMQDKLYGGSWLETLDELEEMPTREHGRSVSHLKVFCDYEVDPRVFYDKYIDAAGIAIIGPSFLTSTSGVRDEFLYMTREIILTMTSERPALRRALPPGEFR